MTTNPVIADNVHVIESYAQSVSQTRKGAAILLLGLAGFVLWAVFAPLDEGVPTEGVISVETNHKVVQHLTGGMVSVLQVHEGQEVQTGDVLFKLDARPARRAMRRCGSATQGYVRRKTACVPSKAIVP